MRKLIHTSIFTIITIMLLFWFPQQVSAASLVGNPNITWSPDGKAFTTDAGETSYENLKTGDKVETGIQSTIREIMTGEHKYKTDRQGIVPIGKWEVSWDRSQCVHDSYPPENNYYGVPFGKNICLKSYKKGWLAYCADCKEKVTDMFFYMDAETARSIKDLDTLLHYYYLCPHCNNLEQGSGLGEHKCNKISWNMYKIKYFKNFGEGFMLPSTHMYNNATLYEGEPITPSARLTPNTYFRFGYEFIGWNTKADGTGISYADKQEILNLTTQNKAEIILYAQWKPSYSTLHIDPAGGIYDGKNTVTSVRQQAGKTYLVDPSKLTPPTGHLVRFETNGGSVVADKRTDKKFLTWQQSFPFQGELKDNLYTHRGKDGTEDHLTASYEDLPIVLPSTSKPGESFAGWYRDSAFEQPAGVPGEKIIITQDTVLYAKWATLVLKSTDNYSVYNGRGGVDLAWNQDDTTQKTYKLYQSGDAKNWQIISQKLGAGEVQPIEEVFGCSYAQQQYRVPYTGLYTLTAAGAQGQDYGGVAGGYGGTVEINVWLSSGDILTYVVGGRNGYNGGGAGNPYGNGGGATTITSAQKGVLLVAGGGGGASIAYVGGAGGLSQSLTDTGTGGSGGAGGGGGYKGGNAGEQIVHYHTDACYHITDKNVLSTPMKEDINPAYIYDYDSDDDPRYAKKITQSYGSLQNPIPTEGATTLKLEANQNNRWGNSGQHTCTDISGIKVYNQSGNLLYSQNLKELEEFVRNEYGRAIVGNNRANGVMEKVTKKTHHDLDGDQSYNETEHTWLHYNADGTVTKYRTIFDDINHPYNVERDGTIYPVHNPWEYFMPEVYSEGNNNWWGSTLSIQRVNVSIPAGTTGIYIEYTACSVESHGLPTAQVTIASLTGGKQLICGYTDGQVISSYPSYGGSNYVNDSYGTLVSSAPGAKAGEGIFTIRLKNAEYFDSLTQSGVKATDYAPPDKVAEDTMKKVPISSNSITLTWEKPKDNGTKYYHKAESYSAINGSKLCDSNITENTLTSGIAGYYWLLDTSASTVVNKTNGAYTTTAAQNMAMTVGVQYFHIATVDVAGNLSGTTHIKVGNADEEVAWEIMTTPIGIASGSSVYPSEERMYYVKADGVTPFTLSFSGFLDHEALPGYQVNRLIFNTTMQGSGENQGFQVFTPSYAPIVNQDIITEAAGLTKTMTGQPLFGDAAYTITTRINLCRNLAIVQKFTVDASYHGKSFVVIPAAGADHKKGTEYSKGENDIGNSITLIADGESPIIHGTEILEHLSEIDRDNGTVLLSLKAEDNLSGVGKFWVEINNTDNYNQRTFEVDAEGNIVIDITKDSPLFVGDFIIIIHAVDNVGNETELQFATCEFTLSARIERMLSPHEPQFRCGESGILYVTASGYVDRIEVDVLSPFFPEKKTIIYSESEYIQNEEIEFMVPLYTEEKGYTVTVRAYKDGQTLEAYPKMSVMEISGTVLDDFRRKILYN